MSDYTSQGGDIGMSNSTLSAFFDSRSEAENAVSRLRSSGVSESSIRLTEGSAGAGSETTTTTTTQTSEPKGFFESLGDMFFPEEDRYAYAEGLSRGGYLVTVVDLTADQRDIALDILDDEGAVNLDERESSWRSEGWTGYDASSSTGSMTSDASMTTETTGTTGAMGSAAAATTSAFTEGERTVGSEEVIPVVEERLRVGKRDASHGRVRVRSYVRETPVSENVNLTSEHVTIQRQAVDRPLTGTEDAFRDRSIEAEEFAEEAVVSKEARVTEEIRLNRERETRTETITDTERKTEVEIEDERTDSTGKILDRP